MAARSRWASFTREVSDSSSAPDTAASRVLPTTEEYRGASLFSRIGGKFFVTRMLIAMVAIGTTDPVFALDSIPAIFGLTWSTCLTACPSCSAFIESMPK
jgi:predicted tellurium resistance membrane protein TerC